MSNSQFAEVRTEPCFTLGHERLIWRFNADRWQHAWEQHRDGLWQPLIHSTDLPKTLTPVYQELFVEERPDGEIEFQLMGQGAGAIFSAAITCSPSTSRARFDLAVRFKTGSPPLPVTATYQAGASAKELDNLIVPLKSPRHAPLAIQSQTGNRFEFLTLTAQFVAGQSNLKPASAHQWGYQFLFPEKTS